LQLSTVDNTIELDSNILVSSNYIGKVLAELQTPKPSFKNIRQIIADSNTDDFEEMYRALYEESSNYMPGKEGTVAILINDHQYKANFRIDKEICLMSLIQNLINNK
jgi:hypothetical protein